MATERDFITPAGLNILTTANVVGNTVSLDMFSNTTRAQTYPVFSQNFAMSPYLDARWTYVRTSNATYMAANGTLAYARANTPRFDYDPVTLQGKGLLFEESRMNMVYNSGQPGGNLWGSYDGVNNQNYSFDLNAGIAPDGTNTATFFRHNSTVSTYYVVYPTTVTPIRNNVTYTYSVFVCSNTSPQEPAFVLAQYDPLDNVNAIYLVFNTSANGSISGWINYGSGANVQLHSIGSQNYPNGWIRVYYSFRYTTGVRSYVQFKTELDGSGLTVANQKTRGIYLWGAQLEEGPFPTSYIPTPAAAVAVRANEYAYIDGNKLNTFKDDKSMTIVTTTAPLAWHGNTTMTASTEQRYNTVWTLLSNPAPPGPFVPAIDSRFPQQGVYFSYLNDASPHRISYYHAMFNNVENYIGFNGYNLTVNNYITNASYITNATTMRSNNWIMVSNGTLSSTNLNYFAGANNNWFQIGGAGNVYFKNLAVYNQQLSNTEMINITTT